jgi:hypothetical protein
MPPPSSYHPNTICSGRQIMQLHIMQLYTVSSSFLPLSPNILLMSQTQFSHRHFTVTNNSNNSHLPSLPSPLASSSNRLKRAR